MPMPSLDIVIVNWNAGGQLQACLASLAGCVQSTFVLSRVIIVDNASTDGSAVDIGVERVPVQVICNETNIGFGRACNQGAKVGTSDYLLFLNPDTCLSGDALQRPLAFLEDRANACVAAAGVQLLDESGACARTCARLPNALRLVSSILGLDRIAPRWFPGVLMRDWAHDETREVDNVMGAYYLVRRRAFEAVGGFDEHFFMYWEDVDLSCRLRAAGWSIVYLADVRVIHVGCGTSGGAKADRMLYALGSRMRYARKHFSSAGALCVVAVTVAVEPPLRLLDAILLKRSIGDVRAVLAGYRMFCARGVRVPFAKRCPPEAVQIH